MRFTTYTKYKGRWLDALNLESLMEQLSDFLLNGGFAGGPHFHPYWGWSGLEDGDSVDALKRALLEALLKSGQLTPETPSQAAVCAAKAKGTRTCSARSPSCWIS